MKHKCPTCQKELTWEKENLFRPFCSKRCKLIDLGEWASESYKVSEKITDDDNDKFN